MSAGQTPRIRMWRYLLLSITVVVLIQGCASTPETTVAPTVDVELEAAKRMARFAFDNGDFEQAENIYRRALERAYVRNDTADILDGRYNLAVCLMALEAYPEAIQLVQQAKVDLVADNEKIPADLLLLDATLLFRSDQLQAALKTTDTILQRGHEISPVMRAKTHFLRGLIFDRRNDLPALDESIRSMGVPQIETLKSDLFELRGRLAMAEKDWDRAVLLLDEASRLRRQDLDYRRMVISQALAAKAIENEGKKEAAASRYLQAGRSAALNGDRTNARIWLTRAALLFDGLGNETAAAESRSLLDDIEAPPESKTQG